MKFIYQPTMQSVLFYILYSYLSAIAAAAESTALLWKINDSSETNQQHYYLNDDVHSRLSSYLRIRSKSHRRPVMHPSDRIDIHVSASLYQLVDLDQRQNLATISTYFDVWWYDRFVQWNESEFDNTEMTFIPAQWIWKPEFYLYHSVEGRTPEIIADAAVEVHSNGRVRMFIPMTTRALCPINVKYFPFDTQNCSFMCGSWSYQSKYLQFVVESQEVFLGDFYDNQEWLLVDATLSNGSTQYLSNETYSMVVMLLSLKRQSFYYVFNLLFPTTVVSLVAVIGFHAPINATGRRETKFRLGIMTLLSMSVMLLMLADEMPKFALESIPGQRGSFSDVPLLGIFHLVLILTISIATCTTSIFVHLEKYALRHADYRHIPSAMRFLAHQHPFSHLYSQLTDRHRRRSPPISTADKLFASINEEHLENDDDDNKVFVFVSTLQYRRNRYQQLFDTTVSLANYLIIQYQHRTDRSI